MHLSSLLKKTYLSVSLTCIGFVSSLTQCVGQNDAYPTREELIKRADATFGEPKDAVRLVKDGRVWVNAKEGQVIVDGFVTLREGQLEMFACPVGTKEHESIVAVFSASRYIHTALLAAGAEKGSPTQFEPYRPASGATIKIQIEWRDAEGKKQTAPAQSWIRNVQTNKEMPYDWVFAGSLFYKDVDTKEERYLADSGDLVCVANFQTATLDLAIKSVASNSSLIYATYTDRIPPLFTVVRLVLQVSDDEPRRGDEPTSDADSETKSMKPQDEKSKDPAAKETDAPKASTNKTEPKKDSSSSKEPIEPSRTIKK